MSKVEAQLFYDFSGDSLSFFSFVELEQSMARAMSNMCAAKESKSLNDPNVYV